MKTNRSAARNPSRGFFALSVAITILAASGGVIMLAGPHHRDTDRRQALAQQPVRANDVAAVDAVADAAAHAQRGDASAGVDILLP